MEQVENLRNRADALDAGADINVAPWLRDAAARIERQATRIAALEGALSTMVYGPGATYDEVHAARALLAPVGDPGEVGAAGDGGGR